MCQAHALALSVALGDRDVFENPIRWDGRSCQAAKLLTSLPAECLEVFRCLAQLSQEAILLGFGFE